MDILELQSKAEYYRNEYRLGRCSREITKEMIMPYLDFVNSKSMELCKKYHQKHKSVDFVSYVR